MKDTMKNQGVFVKQKHYSMPPTATKSKKLFLGQSQDHKVIDLGVIWKGVSRGVCMPNMKSLSLTVQKL